MTKRRKYIVGIVAVLVVLWLVNGWYQRKKNFQFSYQKGEMTTVVRGDLEVPISATGSIEPASKTEIKCKASGKVMKLYFEAGDMVRKNDLLVQLDPVDEQRSVDSAQAEVDRAKASLELASSEAEKVARDWPMQIQTALASLEGVRAALQGAVITFRKQDIIRRGANSEQAVMDVVDVSKVKPVELNPVEGLLDGQLGQLLIRESSQRLGLAAAEVAETAKLVEYGKDVINKSRGELSWEKTGVTALEYQEALITMWQTEAKLIASMADLRNAVNLGILVAQAQKKVVLAREALKQANVALAQAKQRLDDTKVYAPNDGQILELFVREGQIISSGIATVTGGTPLMTLADVSKLYVVADVDEADIGRVRDLAPEDRSGRIQMALSSQPTTSTAPVLTKENEEEMAMLREANNVDVTVDAFREDSFTGKVDRVYPNSKNVNNIVTYNVRIWLNSPNSGKLMLGMHANVKFTSRKLTNILKVANEAIKSKNEEHGVYIEGTGLDAKPVFVPVKVGLTDSVMIELKTDRLQPGQKVYTKLPMSREGDEKTDEE